MDRYTVLKRVGDGTYGEVILATNKQTGEKVSFAILTQIGGVMVDFCST